MGKCPRCSWTGSAAQFQKHYAKKHYKPKKANKKQGKKGPKDKFKVPGFARRKR